MKIVCLANSFREGGRCLGGVALDSNNQPIFENNRPKWIRPVCNTEHHEVPVTLVSHIQLLDIIEFDFVKNAGSKHQTESVLFNEKSIKVTGKFQKNDLMKICENNNFTKLFGNKGKAVPEDAISSLSYSLLLAYAEEFEINVKTYEEKEYPQIRLSFRFNDVLYDLPITDPYFLHQYQSNNAILDGSNKIYISLSLAAPYNDWYFKLIAGIIY